MKYLWLSMLVAALWTPGGAHAEEPKMDARSRFEAALQHARQGELAAALAEFEAAYRIHPHFSVLYNIGQTRSALGRAVEAVDAFEQYLAEGGAQVAGARRDEVHQLIAANEKRIGWLQVREPLASTAQVWLDGVELSRAERARAVRLTVGEHSIIYSTADGPATAKKFSVSANATTEVVLDLHPPAPSSFAQLQIDCDVPGVKVELEGVHRGFTPLTAPLVVLPGAYTLRFSRDGYVPVARQAVAEARAFTRVECAQRPRLPIPRTTASWLKLQVRPSNSRVTFDGGAIPSGPIPSGPHDLLVERDGFIAVKRRISMVAGRTHTLNIDLALTPERRALQERQRAARRTTGYALGGAGVLLLGASGGLYLWNSSRYDDWRGSRLDAPRAASIQRVDDASIGLALSGVALIAYGVYSAVVQ